MTDQNSLDCIFCKITKGEIKTEKIYEDENTYAILDLNPVSPGHTLVIPKEHFENIYTVPPELWARMNIATQKIAIAIRNAVDADGINIIINNEEAAGQIIFHSHIHIIPRHNNDGLEQWSGNGATAEELKIAAEKIKGQL